VKKQLNAIFSRFPPSFIQFIKFGIVGLSNTFISYVIYSLLVYVHLHYLAASIIAFVVSVLNSFYWNMRYVFKGSGEKKDILKSLLRTFLAYGFTGLVLQNILLYVQIEVLGVSPYLAPVFSLIITVPLNFILNKFWAFNKKEITSVNS
jgi:putative flippase GtrA